MNNLVCDEKYCSRCKENIPITKLIIKMGGLICHKCRLILITPDDPMFRSERLRRNKIQDDLEKK